MQIQTLAHSLQTINWLGDRLVDWCRAGICYALNGEESQLYKYHFGYQFDAAIHSADGQYAFVYEKLGTKGLLLKNGEILREINRSYYHANAYEYPAAFVQKGPVTYLVHCPLEYCRLDVENAETGEIVTDVPGREPTDFFHSRLEVSPGNTYLLSKGWCWQPFDIVALFNIDDCLASPPLLDQCGRYPAADGEINTASFVGDSTVLLGSLREPTSGEETPANTLQSGQVGQWDLRTNALSHVFTPDFPFGNLIAINENFAWDTYQFPKIVDLRTGQVIDQAPDMHSGDQCSSIIWHLKDQPQLAIDGTRKRLAISNGQKVTILTAEEPVG